jgi:hypothetical protein
MTYSQLYAVTSAILLNSDIYGLDYSTYLATLIGNTNNNIMTLIGIEKYLLDWADTIAESNDPASLLNTWHNIINQIKEYLRTNIETEQLSIFRTHLISQASNCINRDKVEILEELIDAGLPQYTSEESAEVIRVLTEGNWVITRED